MADIFAGPLLEKLASGGLDLICNYVKGRIVDPKTIDDMKRSLEMVAAMLRDAQRRHIQSDTYIKWVQKLQDLAYDLEDILDELVTDEHLLKLQQEDEDEDEDGTSKARNIACIQSIKATVKRILASGSQAMRKHLHYYGSGDLPSKIRDMNSRLENSHIQGRKEFRLSDVVDMQQEKNYSVEDTVLKSLLETTSVIVNKQPILGRDDKKSEIIQKLLKDDSSKNENYVVIPIVGNGGMGKTTLAQHVYNDNQVKDHFKFKSWVCVSDTDKPFDVEKVTDKIIKSATRKTLDEAQHQLEEELKDKRFLIVLDDVWTECYDNWNKLQIPFHCGANGSRVIVTTRNERIGRMMRRDSSDTIIDLAKLSDDICWRIFLQHVNQKSDDDLVKMQSEIVEKCDGLPLAAKALGGLFSKKTDPSQRRRMLDDDNVWREEGHVLPVLRLSYFHLPSHLKSIFAYCSIFPKDYEFKEMEVIHLWMAQGFLPENEEERVEVIGHHYFLDLVQRSLFEHSPSHEDCYVMHDLVHDLSQWAASDTCLCVMDTKDMKRDLARTRHLSICTHVTDQFDQARVAHQLRTFLCRTQGYVDVLNIELQDFISGFRCIRTLFLASDTNQLLPECIGDLKHLRYLDLQFKKLTVLPKSIRKLCNLQMLFLSECCDLRKVSNIKFLVKLRHVRFPQSLWEALTPGIGNLTNLQTLGKMYLGEDHGKKSMVRELRNLNSLYGKLSVVGMQNVRKVEDAKEAQLHEKRGLEKLCFKWLQDGNDDVDDKTKRDVLEELKPNSCIKECELDGYMGSTLPSWLGDSSFENMVTVKLVNCEKCDSLPPMEKLPSLKKLCIEGMKVWSGWVHGDMVTFRWLEELIIRNCDSFLGNLQTHLPLLKIITIVGCPKARVTFPNSPHLEKLKIDNCEALLSSTSETMVICRFSKKIFLRKIKSGMISLEVDGPCHGSLEIEECESVVTIKKIPDTLKRMVIRYCEKLKRVEFEESPTSNNNNNHNISINIENCDSVVSVGNIPLTVGRLDIRYCKSLEAVMCGGKWNLFNSSEATVGGKGDGPLKLPHLKKLWIWGCPQFMSLPEGLLLPSIDDMSFIDNENQNALPDQMHSFTSLSVLNIINCPKFPVEGLPRNITWLNIEEMKIKKEIITRGLGLDGFNKLKTIYIYEVVFGDPITECIEIEGKDNVTTGEDDDDKVKEDEAASESEELSSFRCLPSSCLSSVVTGGFNCLPSSCFPKLMLLPQPQPQTQTLDDCIDIDHKPKRTHINENASNSITLYLPTISLNRLEISGLENLKSINCSTFPNLTDLCIFKCPKLESLGPDNCLPPKIKDVLIEECPLIQRQCTPDPNGHIRFNWFSDERYTISKKQIHS